MRNVIILRGPKLSGKTHFVQQHDLSCWHVDQTAINRAFASPTLNESGKLQHNQFALRKAQHHIMDIIHEKLRRSDFIVFEADDSGLPEQGSAENDTDKLIQRIIAQAKLHRYVCTVVDFSSTSPRQVSDSDIVKYYSDTSKFTVHSVHEASGYVRKIKDPRTDISHLDAIVAIGDIHGQAKTLDAILRQIPRSKNMAYVFTGDYINKGPNSAQTLRMVSEFFHKTDNCFLLSGNHEMMLENWAYNRGPGRDVFDRDTAPDLRAAHYTRREARAFLDKTSDLYRLKFKGYDITVTHGGLSAPSDIHGYLPGHIKRMGVGHAGTDIDRLWEVNAPSSYNIQIHGHRNDHGVTIPQSQTSFNVEGIDSFKAIRGMVLTIKNGALNAKGFALKVKSK